MKRFFMFAVAIAVAFCSLFAADSESKSWTFAGVESTQSKVVFDNYPVLLGAGSASGSWVLNSTTASYAKTSTTWVTTGNAKTLQLGSSSVSPAGTTLTLAAAANPIPANATITAVELLLKSVNTESDWCVSVNGAKASATLTAASATAMGDCTPLRFENVNLEGNVISFKIESMATSGRYVYVAGATVEYTVSSAVVPGEKVSAPVFSPASGASLESGSVISLSSKTEGATVYCAIGSSAFTECPDGKVTVEGAVGSTVSLRAYASKTGMDDSDIASASYTIKAAAVNPPYAEIFDNSSALNAWTVIDSNSDNSVWRFYSGDGSAYIEHQLGDNGKDDWLISPALKLDAGQAYTLRFDVRAGNAAYPEKISVAYGDAPTAAAMTEELIPVTTVDYTDYKTQMCRIVPLASGDYHIGFHAASDAGMYRLFVDNVRLSAGTVAAAPAAVTEISVVNNPDGLNKAEISFKAPENSLSGNTLESLTKIEVRRDGSLIKVFENPLPGAVLTFVDEPESAAEFLYHIEAFNAYGEGADVEVKAFVGINIPAGPTAARFTEPSAGVVSITWTAPERTVYGDAINSSLIRYKIYDTAGNILAENVEGCSWQCRAVEEGNQILLGFKVVASTAAGSNDKEVAETDLVPIGTPYNIPFKESFTRWMPTTLAEFVTPEGSTGSWRAMRELITTGVMAYDGDDGILAFFADYTGDEACYRTGKIAIPIDATDAMLTFYLFNDADNGGEIEVGVEAADGTSFTEAISPDWNGWKEHIMPLKDFAGKVVRLFFTATAGTLANVTAIDLVEVKRIKTHDLAAGRFRVPLEMELLRPHLLSLDVTNIGIEQAEGYTVDLLCDGVVVESQTPAPLARNESVTLHFSITPGSDVESTYSAVVNYSADGDTDNNGAETVTPTVIKPLYAPVENLLATPEASGIVLSWDVPSSANTVPVTETFERYDEFGINTAGDWTFYDVDGGDTYGINDKVHSFPNMAQPMAYIVFNGTIPTLETIGSMTFGAHSGNQYLASFSIQGGETVNNDWIVSPLLNGKAQSVSFFIRSMSIGAHEKFEFLTSKTGKSIENFTKLGEGEDNTGTWTKFEYNVPEGTRYFAIRCVSFDQYAFFLDDISYTPAAAETDKIAGYDIFRDGTKLNDRPVVATTFTDTFADTGKHVYAVCAVMPRGLSPAASVSVETTGVENVGVSEHVEVYNLQGQRVESNTENLPSGIYIIRRGGITYKIRR